MSTIKSRRVAITGLGVLAPNADRVADYFEALCAGVNAIDEVTRFDKNLFSSHLAAEIKNFNPDSYDLSAQELTLDRSAQFALVASSQAVTQARIKACGNTRVHLGMTTAGFDSVENGYHLSREGRAIPEKFWDRWLPQSSADAVADHFQFSGQRQLFSTGCTSGSDALGFAFQAIQSGMDRQILCVATEAPITPLIYVSFCAMHAFSRRNDDPRHASRPFDAKRDGFVLGEGAAALVLEELEQARERGVPILAEVVGYGTTLSAYHMNRPDPEGVESARAMKLAIDQAGIAPDQIGYIAYHGSSTQLNEKSETNAVKKAFGSAAYKVPGSSIKSMIGHPLGSAGTMQTVAAVMALQNGWLPPTINYEFPDPDCDLDYIPNLARKKDIEYALVNSSGFGGKNSALVLKRFN